jgi:glycerophosphoryl diester phosphodiesterase
MQPFQRPALPPRRLTGHSFFDSCLRSLRLGWRPIWLVTAALATLGALPAAAFDLQGHRGARGLAPENTLPAFERALAIGVTTLELDVSLSADGVVVIAHDPFLNPLFTRDAGGQWLSGSRGPLIRSLSLAQLQSYDVGRIQPGTPYASTFGSQQAVDGTHIPTLAALFERVRMLGDQNVRFNIETKINPEQPENSASPEQLTDALLQVVRDAGMLARVSIQSFDWRTLQQVQRLEPGIATVYLTVQSPNNDSVRSGTWTAGFKIAQHASVPAMVKAAGGAVWSPNGGALTQALVQQAQALGLKVIPWTINQASDMERLIGWGVDGLITDYPDRLRDIMRQRQLPLPAPLTPLKNQGHPAQATGA